MTYCYAGMTLSWTSGRNRFVINIGVVNGAIAVDGDRRIGALRLRDRVRHSKRIPCGAAVGTEYATLQTAALIHWQPGSSIWGDMNVAVYTAAGSAGKTRALTGVGQNGRAITRPQSITAITGSRTDDILRAIVDGLALVHWCRQYT